MSAALAVVCAGLLICALTSRSDLDSTQDRLDSTTQDVEDLQSSQQDQQEITGGRTVPAAGAIGTVKVLYDDLAEQLGATQEDLAGTAQDLEAASKQAAQADEEAAAAKGQSAQADDETDKAKAETKQAQARSSVNILMFGWREGESGRRLVELLELKLSDDVAVRAIIDGMGSRPYGRARELLTRLAGAGAGAQIVVNDVLPPIRRGLFPDGLRRDGLGRADHRRLYVIDGAVGWTGGAGIEDQFADGRFHDVMVRFTGAAVRQAQAAFLTSYHGHGGPMPEDLAPYLPAPAEAGTTPPALVQVIPGGFVAASQAIAAQIDGSRKRSMS